MIYVDMKTYSNGRKKKYDAYNKPKTQIKSQGTLNWSFTSPRKTSSTIKSLTTKETHTQKVEPQRYTGSLIKGISTMHKSNAVPVINEEEMKDHAAMRR